MRDWLTERIYRITGTRDFIVKGVKQHFAEFEVKGTRYVINPLTPIMLNDCIKAFSWFYDLLPKKYSTINYQVYALSLQVYPLCTGTILVDDDLFNVVDENLIVSYPRGILYLNDTKILFKRKVEGDRAQLENLEDLRIFMNKI